MFGGAGFMFFGALFYWFPKMFGKMYNQKWGTISFVVFFIGFNALYIPLFLAGLNGMPRRYQDYLPEYEVFHAASTYGSWILIAGVFMMVVVLIRGLLRGPQAPMDPWHGLTLEWTVPSPPPTHQFHGVPEITHGPYDYHLVGLGDPSPAQALADATAPSPTTEVKTDE